jgi:hypothetical protein
MSDPDCDEGLDREDECGRVDDRDLVQYHDNQEEGVDGRDLDEGLDREDEGGSTDDRDLVQNLDNQEEDVDGFDDSEGVVDEKDECGCCVRKQDQDARVSEEYREGEEGNAEVERELQE